MNQGKITLEANYNLNSENEEHQVRAELKNFQLRQLNKTIAALAPVSIKKGFVHAAKVNYKANNFQAVGTLDLHYTDLWIELIKNEEKQKHFGIISFVANNLLKKNNVPATAKYKQGKIQCSFNPQKSILNYMWSAVKSGLKSSISRSKKK